MSDCPHCLRHYERKVYLDRHVGMCQMLTKTKRERKLEIQEQDDTPSVRDLYTAVLELTEKYSQLEKKFTDLSKYATIKKQKINIIDWLNTTYNSRATDYQTWFNAIQVQYEDLDILFKADYVGGVVAILQKLLPLEDETRPLRAFAGKENVFYVYRQHENRWETIESETFTKLMHLFDKQFMVAFVQWQNENKHRMHLDDFSEIYAKNVKKIMGGNYTREQLYSRIKRELYQYMRAELPTMLEYEVC